MDMPGTDRAAEAQCETAQKRVKEKDREEKQKWRKKKIWGQSVLKLPEAGFHTSLSERDWRRLQTDPSKPLGVVADPSLATLREDVGRHRSTPA
jgi:hypothetical protein